MFEVSFRAGIAGNYQWGLDAGYHDDWNLYANLPAAWKVRDYVGGKEELEIGPDYIHYIPRGEASREQGKTQATADCSSQKEGPVDVRNHTIYTVVFLLGSFYYPGRMVGHAQKYTVLSLNLRQHGWPCTEVHGTRTEPHVTTVDPAWNLHGTQ
ncbi:hypothetical protein BYT27DRAFT_6903636 [Phlegmacium glaucopus]|nr:hypothetical protein BYT27DRAFT_6903636 [Phlegmacium glaucopus]